jgi:hypothetical protein
MIYSCCPGYVGETTHCANTDAILSSTGLERLVEGYINATCVSESINSAWRIAEVRSVVHTNV